MAPKAMAPIASSNAAEGYVTDVPYVPGFYPALAPTLLRFVASLNGFAPPEVSKGFHYLEIGCGFGDTLLTLAAANPIGTFTGVDINPVHTQAVEQRIRKTGLSNVRVLTSDCAQLPADLPPQQFIAMHGVWSWVSPQVREQIVAIARERLAPGGLLLVSYNVLTGWAPLLPVRSLVREFAAECEGDSLEKMRHAAQRIKALRDTQGQYFVNNPVAAEFVDDMAKHDLTYLTHEFLGDHWKAFECAEVAALFRPAGLTFAGSFPVSLNLPDLCIAPRLNEFRAQDNRAAIETRKDLLINQSFRWDIYAKHRPESKQSPDRFTAADDLSFRLSQRNVTLPFQESLTAMGAITVTIDGPPHDTLVEMLRERCWRLAEIASDPRCADVSKDDLIEAIDLAVSLGLFCVDAQPLQVIDPLEIDRVFLDPAAEDSNSLTRPARLRFTNQFNADQIVRPMGLKQLILLASPVRGSGDTIKILHSIVLDELVHGSESDRETLDFVTRVERRIAARGPGIVERKTGREITEPADRRAAVTAICREFQELILPDLLALGIVAIDA